MHPCTGCRAFTTDLQGNLITCPLFKQLLPLYGCEAARDCSEPHLNLLLALAQKQKEEPQ